MFFVRSDELFSGKVVLCDPERQVAITIRKRPGQLWIRERPGPYNRHYGKNLEIAIINAGVALFVSKYSFDTVHKRKPNYKDR